jgi:hypothetical protein
LQSVAVEFGRLRIPRHGLRAFSASNMLDKKRRRVARSEILPPFVLQWSATNHPLSKSFGSTPCCRVQGPEPTDNVVSTASHGPNPLRPFSSSDGPSIDSPRITGQTFKLTLGRNCKGLRQLTTSQSGRVATAQSRIRSWQNGLAPDHWTELIPYQFRDYRDK